MLREDVLWTAITARDSRWDGAFVYGVPSTRIYCRPTCPSRRPRRDGVRFFAAAAAAEAAGFRACRRCHPNSDRSLPLQIERVRRVCQAIASRAHEKLSLARLARVVGGNPQHLQRTFRQVLGVSPREYADACRMGCLRDGLRNGNGVAAATYAAGYGSGSRVYERAPRMLGMTPASYARGGKGETVKYVVVDSPLGNLLVAATPRGVCAVKIGSTHAALEAELRHEYPSAHIDEGDASLNAYVRSVVASVEPGAPDARLPLDIRATAFQRRVWRELQQIPRGATESYQEIARRIGRPAAARAVARACASNPVALVIPCHRVIRGDGALGGYHWGTSRKRALLEAERAGAK
jgi:AraC family transcriptional regulator of adaptative response/methylated-DNA-[protein]-cysteine methyltransferase